MTWGRRENLEIIDEQDLEQLPRIVSTPVVLRETLEIYKMVEVNQKDPQKQAWC
tara:strand:- start:168368 stop:168529 length:162 start_codon:yes stop_codon:yes gene_type:complete